MTSIGILGGGAWGTALAATVARAGQTPLLWARDNELVSTMNATRQNASYLAGVSLPESVQVTNDISKAASCDFVLIVTPAQALRQTLLDIKPTLKPDAAIVLCCKGLEQGSLKMMTEVTTELVPGQPVAVLSGPSFAIEVAKGHPTAVTLAANEKDLAKSLTEQLGSATFRPYASDDPVGAEIGGAVKNVLAIACGVARGMSFGENTRAALITRGLAEMARFGAALGGRPETLMGLSGLGDLMLTCSSLQSRNTQFGVRIGEGMSTAESLGATHSVVEGAHSAHAVVERAHQLGVEMPICEATDAIVNGGADPKATIESLLARPFRTEI